MEPEEQFQQQPAQKGVPLKHLLTFVSRASFCRDAQRAFSIFYDWLLKFLFFPSCLPGFLACSFGLLNFKRFFGLPAFSPCYFHRATSPGHTLYCASYKKSEQWLLDSHLLRLSAAASTHLEKSQLLSDIIMKNSNFLLAALTGMS